MTPLRTALLVPIVVAAALSGCGGDGATDATPTTTAATPSSTTAPRATVSQRAAVAADAFIAALTPEQRTVVALPFDRAAISTGWHDIPLALAPRAGIAVGDLSVEQREMAIALAATVLSDGGSAVLNQVIRAQAALADAVAAAPDLPDVTQALIQLASDQGLPLYSDEQYFVAVYGTPSTSTPWAFQLSGHHWARTFVFDDNDVSITPAAVGTDPDFPGADDEAMALIEERIDATFRAVAGLTPDQLARGRIDEDIRDVVLGPGEDVWPAIAGVPYPELTDEQQSAVRAAIDGWLADIAPEVAEPLRQRYDSELDGTSVAFANSTDPGQVGAYARIHGPTLWIEAAVREANVGSEVHVHALHRDASDFATGG